MAHAIHWSQLVSKERLAYNEPQDCCQLDFPGRSELTSTNLVSVSTLMFNILSLVVTSHRLER